MEGSRVSSERMAPMNVATMKFNIIRIASLINVQQQYNNIPLRTEAVVVVQRRRPDFNEVCRSIYQYGVAG